MTRKIIITPVLNGWIVDVGCQSVVFTDIEIMLDELEKYYKDPEAMEKTYLKNHKNKVCENRLLPNPDYVTPGEVLRVAPPMIGVAMTGEPAQAAQREANH